VVNRHRVDTIPLEKRVARAASAVDVELLLQQGVDCIVEGERKALRSADAEPAVDVEATGALDEQLEL
jgi:hypothetical protein